MATDKSAFLNVTLFVLFFDIVTGNVLFKKINFFLSFYFREKNLFSLIIFFSLYLQLNFCIGFSLASLARMQWSEIIIDSVNITWKYRSLNDKYFHWIRIEGSSFIIVKMILFVFPWFCLFSDFIWIFALFLNNNYMQGMINKISLNWPKSVISADRKLSEELTGHAWTRRFSPKGKTTQKQKKKKTLNMISFDY